MPKTRHLLRREVTYSDIKDEEFNMLHKLGYHAAKTQFFEHLTIKKDWMRAVVCHHLGLNSPNDCQIAPSDWWLHGSFNVCIPVMISSWQNKKLLMRFPLPYHVGEAFRPGNCDEKIRCEAGAYSWLEKNCPEIPIPKLYGFALSTGETFTCSDLLPCRSRYFYFLRQTFISWFWAIDPSGYAPHQFSTNNTIDDGYLLIEFIEDSRGSMLSNTWEEGRHDSTLRSNLFNDLSRILLNLARFPLPRIGSFIIDNKGFLRLTNRPLSMEIQQLENEEIPTDIPRDFTYSTVDSYIVDSLAFHDNRFRYQPNAVNDLEDCAHQLSILTAMRTIHQSIFSRAFRRGPFIFTLTDLHQSNTFVDEEWHVTCLVDLEWACSLPLEMCSSPWWLTSKGVDRIDRDEYDEIRQEFMQTLSTQEKGFGSTLSVRNSEGEKSPVRLSDTMNKSWESGAFWYTLSLSSPSGIFSIFNKHIRHLFCRDHEEEFQVIMPFYFEKNVGQVAGRKLEDKKIYDEDLRKAFESDEDCPQ